MDKRTTNASYAAKNIVALSLSPGDVLDEMSY